MSLDADGDIITLVPGGIGALFALYRLRRSWRLVGGPLREVFARANVKLYVRVGWLGRVQLLPDPGFLFRLTLPRN